jgi:AhpD family alkylhydroperoxidase
LTLQNGFSIIALNGVITTEKRIDPMMIDWNEYHAQVVKTIAEIGRSSPDIVRGYRTITDAGKSTSVLTPKIRELIALAVAVTVQCDGCIVVHTDAALKNGATEEEIIEALGVAVAVKAGSGLIFSTRALDALKAKTGKEAAGSE